MITFRTVTDSLGTAHFFKVDDREAGYVAQSLDGTYILYFSTMADAPHGATLERDIDPGSDGAILRGIASLEAALALVRRAYTADATSAQTAVYPRSVPKPSARDAVRVALPFLSTTTERAAFFHNATYPQPLNARNTQ